MPSPLWFLNSSNFTGSEQNYRVLVCIFLVAFCKEHFGNKIILICRNIFVSPALHVLSPEGRCHDVHVFQIRENTDDFITLDESIYGIQSKRINILYKFRSWILFMAT